MRTIIHFEDKHQDFLRWTVENNVVIESSGQNWIWRGTKIIGDISVGNYLKIIPVSESFEQIRHIVVPQSGENRFEVYLKYKVEKIKTIDEPNLVECVECGLEQVDPGVGVRCENDIDDEFCGGRLEKKIKD